MITNENSVCNFNYLSETVGGEKIMMRGIMDAFLIQVSDDTQSVNEAIAKTDYVSIKRITHGMKSSAGILGISVIKPVLQEMEALGASATNIDRIKELNQMLNIIYKQVIIETERAKLTYI